MDKRRAKLGFTLIELVLAIAIGSIIMISLQQLIVRATKTVQTIRYFTDIGEQLSAFYAQLEKDIGSMAVPRSTQAYYTELFQKDFQAEQKELSERVASQENPENNKQTEKKDIIQKAFVLDVRSGQLLLSFITTGGLALFEVKENQVFIKPRSQLVRVAYVMQKDIETGTSSLIYRIARDSLAFKHVTSTTSEEYVLLRGIQQLNITLTVHEFIDPKKREKQQTPVISQWNEELIRKYKSVIPAYITISGSIIRNNRVHNFSYKFEVYSYRQFVPSSIKKPAQQDEQQATQQAKRGSL